MNAKLKQIIANRIYRNGGYSNRDGKWPLEWNVALYTDMEWDTAIGHAEKQFGEFGIDANDSERFTLLRAVAEVKREYDPHRMWEWIQEDMYNGLNDDDGRRTCSPAVFRKWGITEPKNGLYFDVKLELRGSGGKHLVIAEFEGVKLEGVSSERMAEVIVNGDDSENYGNEWLRKLAAYVEECDKMFTRENAEGEFYYQLGWQVACMIDDKLAEMRARDERLASEREAYIYARDEARPILQLCAI